MGTPSLYCRAGPLAVYSGLLEEGAFMTIRACYRTVVCLMAATTLAPAADTRHISIMPADHEAVLREEGFEVWTRQPDFIVGAAVDAAIERLSQRGITPLAEYADGGDWMFLLHHRPGFEAPKATGATIHALSPETELYLFPAGSKVELPMVKPYAAFQGVPRIPLPPRVTHPADLASALTLTRAPAAVNPLVSQILAATSQPSWFQMVRELSGDLPVVIGGQTYTISTRYSDAMFPTPLINAHATEYIEDKEAQWGYTSHRETYTSTDSGCGGVQSQPWQNLIVIVPGQVDYGQHQQVLFVNHYDTISFSTAESNSYAPGADDAISGGTALLEAMRTFKDYGFKNTLVFAFFSGEEVGICGSGAYVRMHPSVDMWRALNMDQTAYDGNGNRFMDVYNWDTTNSPGSVAMGDAFVQANTDYGGIIGAGRIVRDASKMCQTDHCPFWDVGVPAIAVLEDLHNGDICPCFDQGQTSTCHDSVTQLYPVSGGSLMFMQDYSWPSEKAAIALIASLAEPLYACPASPVDPPIVTSGNNTAVISWTAAAGVTNYVVERAATCAGPFAGIASVTGTGYEDTSVVNGGAYAYRIRTCPTQVSDCVTASPSAAASVEYQAGSASLTNDSGDHDAIADNCELVTVQLNLVNDGNVPLDNVRLASVTSSNPAVRIASAIPQLAGSLAPGATAPVSFKFYLGRDGISAACGDPLGFTVTATSDQSPASTRAFSLTAERSTVDGPLTYGFETDMSGWSTIAGVVNRVGGGAPGSTGSSLHFRTAVNNDCNGVQSPTIEPTATSTMSMYVDYILENGNYDRANVRAVDAATGEKFLLSPTGATYNTAADSNLLCDNLGNLKGWSGSFASWRQANFDLSPYAGKEIKIEARESTDASVTGSQGFWMDLVQVTNATQINCDAQSETCAALPPEVSPEATPVPLTIDKSGTDLVFTFSESTGAASYNLYRGSLTSLGQGIYDHAALGGLCGFLDGAVGDGSVAVTLDAASIPDDSYLLAVAESSAGESRYGSSTGGAEIPLALNACP
jgi:Peptidase family M28